MPPINTQKQQQELFDEFVVVKKTRGRFFGVLNKFNKPLFPQHRLNISVSYEVLIIVLIGAVLAVSVVFSLGVERGRNLSGKDIAIEEIETPATVEPVSVQVAEAPEPATQAAPVNVEPPKPAAQKPYTIQVASYKAKDMADKELSRLRSAGYSAEVIKKGNYFILCVGSFESKDSAKKVLSEMQKKYKGCYTRKR